MKHLLLIRHAKSNWDNANLADFERPLSETGIRDAKIMEKFLTESNLKPNLILCSSARRAQQTYDIIFGADKLELTMYLNDLYQSGDAELLDIIKSADEKVKNLVIIGHNPSLQNTLELLTGEKFKDFQTSAIACLQINLEWEKVATNKTKLIYFKKPKDFSSC